MSVAITASFLDAAAADETASRVQNMDADADADAAVDRVSASTPDTSPPRGLAGPAGRCEAIT